MKVVITGDTHVPREELCGRLTTAGLEVLNSVSRLTAVLVCNDSYSDSTKSQRARKEGTYVVDEETILRLLTDVRPGVPKDAPASRAVSRSVPARNEPRRATPAGPLSGRRVLVLGGTHADAAAVRAAVVAAGGGAAVNLSANVTDLLLLDGADADPRLARAVAAGVNAHRGPVALGIQMPTTASIETATSDALSQQHAAEGAAAPADTGAAPADVEALKDDVEQPAQAAVLPRGAVIDLPPGAVWTVNAAWRAGALADGCEVDVVAFLLDNTEQVTSDDEFVFWNAPISEDGAVALSVDGDSEQGIRIDLDLLPEHCARVTIAAALTGATTFGQLGAVALSVDSDQETVAVSTLDAGTTETVLVLGEVYRRGDRWRVRAVGQGYDDGLTALARRYGVAVDD
jgi:DNA polymerase-3 subunit epsilon